MIKTLHEALKRFDEEFTPGTNLFSEYVLWTSDCNGDFLRTRFVSKSSKQKDKELEPDTFIILAMSNPFDVEDINYHRDYSTHKLTKLKLQVCWVNPCDLDDMLGWSLEVGYSYRYVLDCSTGKIMQIEDIEPK